MIALALACHPRPAEVPEARSDLPAIPRAIEAFEWGAGPGAWGWSAVAVRLPRGHGDDLWLAFADEPLAIGPHDVVRDQGGSEWGLFWLVGAGDPTLYDGDEPHPLRPSAWRWDPDAGGWATGRAFRRCRPGEALTSTVTLALGPPGTAANAGWDPGEGGTARFVARVPCVREPAGDALGPASWFFGVEDVDGAGAPLRECVANALARDLLEPSRERWRLVTTAGRTRIDWSTTTTSASPCAVAEELRLPDGVREVEVSWSVADAEGMGPRRERPPAVPLVRFPARGPAPRFSEREWLLYRDVPEALVEGEWGSGWLTIRLPYSMNGELWGTRWAESELVRVLRRGHPPLTLPTVRCSPARIEATTSVIVFDGAQCWRVDAAAGEPGPYGVGTRLALLTDLELTGTAVQQGEEWDWSGVSAAVPRATLYRIEAEPPFTSGVMRWTSLADHALAGTPVPVCTRPPQLADVANEVALRCGPAAGPTVLVAVVASDGSIPVAQAVPADAAPSTSPPEYAACAEAAIAAVRLPPTGCPAWPLVLRL